MIIHSGDDVKKVVVLAGAYHKPDIETGKLLRYCRKKREKAFVLSVRLDETSSVTLTV